MDTGEEQETTLLEIVQFVVRRKGLIVKVCCTAAALSIAYSLTLPNIYSATAKILPPQRETGANLSSLLGQAGGLAGLAGGNLPGGGGELYIGILNSRSVADAVIKRPEINGRFAGQDAEAARAELAGAVKVQGGRDGIISIVADDLEPKCAAALANAFVDELGKITIRLNLSKAGTERSFLEKRLEVVRKELTAAEDDLKAFSQRNKVVQVDSQAKASIDSIAHLKAELASKEVQLAILSGKQTDQSPEVKALQNAIRRLKSELSALASSGGGAEGIPAIGNVPGVGLEYARKLRELKTQEAVYEQLTKQYEVVKLNEAKDSSSFQVLDEAVVPTKKSKPRRSVIVLLSTASAFFASIFFVFLQEYWIRMSAQKRSVLRGIGNDLIRFR